MGDIDWSEKYICGESLTWFAEDSFAKKSNEAIAGFDGWLESLARWQVLEIRNDIARTFRPAAPKKLRRK